MSFILSEAEEKQGEISNLEQSVTVVTYPKPLTLQNHIVFSNHPAEFQETAALFYTQALFHILVWQQDQQVRTGTLVFLN